MIKNSRLFTKVLALLVIVAILPGFANKSELTYEEYEEKEESTSAENDVSKYDYLDHASYLNEDRYTTVLGDISQVGRGEPVIALKEPSRILEELFQFEDSSLSKKGSGFGYDMRYSDVSKLDISVIENYNDISFSNNTKFSDDPDELPAGFDPEFILEFNKNPGLNIRELHKQGITGQGVSIAIIDQALLIDHEQYNDNLMYYERIHCAGGVAQMHGPAVSSIAVGKDIGVAPDAKLYYIATTHGHHNDGTYDFDASIIADCILRILEINENLPENEKIRVISISRGYSASDKGYKEITAAIDKANNENIFVITTSTKMYYRNFDLFGADRDYLESPDEFESYIPASWIAYDVYTNKDSYSQMLYKNLNIFPMGSRTIASSTGTNNYEISHDGGLSWAVPWCAGLYALCCQVKPDITPQEFIDIVNSTSVRAKVDNKGRMVNFGKMVNPPELIKALQESL